MITIASNGVPAITQKSAFISTFQHKSTRALTDENLFTLCKKYGEQALEARRKFLGLLPEVNKRRLYEKKGFTSIFEFAAKLAGVSQEQVRRVLNLEKKFEDTPILKSMLENGEVSLNKLVKIASIATSENQENLAEQVKVLPCRALETLVRDERNGIQMAVGISYMVEGGAAGYQNKNRFQEPLFKLESRRTPLRSVRAVHVNTRVQSNITGVNGRGLQNNPQTQVNNRMELISEFTDETISKLLELKRKGLEINKIINEMLEKRELGISQQKEEIAAKAKPTESRYISAKIKTLIRKEHGNKCSAPNCPHPAKITHHTNRFSLTHIHDPRFLAPLCREHHLIAHSIDNNFWEILKSKT
jgi:hypothetical protein